MWEFGTDAKADAYFVGVSDELRRQFGMSSEEAIARINYCFRGGSLVDDEGLELYGEDEQARAIALGGYWWIDTDLKKIKPPPPDFNGPSVADRINETRPIPLPADLTGMTALEVEGYFYDEPYYRRGTFARMVSRIDCAESAGIVLRVLQSEMALPVEERSISLSGYNVARLIEFGDDSVCQAARSFYAMLPASEQAIVRTHLAGGPFGEIDDWH
ncbi:hypothetical protein GCM10011591_27460 [Nocardia camponoti]|uniref:Uncharacterized protein n=1 Tax=Nocardia camponoti TaxID=1616106 RepID=A0A917QK02_9NOCA|nr:hypothetical protein GCM10011591_27460 [Nocardia camponoti]